MCTPLINFLSSVRLPGVAVHGGGREFTCSGYEIPAMLNTHYDKDPEEVMIHSVIVRFNSSREFLQKQRVKNS